MHFNLAIKQCLGDSFWSMSVDGGRLYAAGDGGVYQFDVTDGEWNLLATGLEYAYRVQAIGSDVYAMNSSRIVCVADGAAAKTIALPDTDAEPSDFLVAGDDLYVADYGYTHKGTWELPTNGKGLFLSHDQGVTWALKNDGLGFAHVARIRRSRDGRIFCSTPDGLHELEGGGVSWRRIVAYPGDTVGGMEFDVFHDSAGKAERLVYAIGRKLVMYSLSASTTTEYPFPDVVSQLPMSISVDPESQRMLTTHWNNGVVMWDADTMASQVFLRDTVWSTCGAILGRTAITGAYGGYLSSFSMDIDARIPIRIDKGLAGNNNLRSAILFSGDYYAGSTSGMVRMGPDSGEPFVSVADPASGAAVGEIECMRLGGEQDSFYFQDYDLGIWRYKDGSSVKVPLFGADGREPLGNLGAGTDFRILGDTLFVCNSKWRNGKYGGFRAYGIDRTNVSGTLLREADGLPSFLYGSNARFDIEGDLVALACQGEPSDSLYGIYVSKDRGAVFSKADSGSGPYTAAYGGKAYYLKDGVVWAFDAISGKKRNTGISALMLFRFGECLACVDRSGQLSLYPHAASSGSLSQAPAFQSMIDGVATGFQSWDSGFAILTKDSIEYFTLAD
jgi:hypothetical protein